jgi:hypothetical protein
MLYMSKSLLNRAVMSLQTGSQISTAIEPVINQILGWWCAPKGGGIKPVLLAEDVREMIPQGIAVNDESALTKPEDLVRHKEILDIKFQLIDKTVKTKSQKLGKVNDFSYNDGLFVQKLYVSRPVTKIFSGQDTLLIDRTQILEVTDHYILVKDTEVPVAEQETVPASAIATP